MRTSYLLSSMATALVGLTGSAYAGVLDVTNVQVPYYESVSWTSNTLANGVSTGTGAGIAGEILLTTPAGTYASWCVDLFHTVGIGGSYTYSTVPLSVDNSGANPDLYDSMTNPGGSNPLSADPQKDIAWLAAGGTAAMNSGPSNDVSAAYQAAIWTVEYGLTGVTGPDSGFTSEYDALIADIGAGDGLVGGPGSQLSTPLSGGLYTAQNLYTSSVPEPSTYAMMAMGFAGLGFAGLRKARAKPALA
jgi:hypothetical protein